MGTQFACFTSTKVQILTPEELQAQAYPPCSQVNGRAIDGKSCPAVFECVFFSKQEVTEEKTNTHICRGMPQPSPTVRQQPAPHLQLPQQYQPQQQPAPHLQQQQQYPLQQRMMGAHEMTDEEVTYVRAYVCACVCVCVCVFVGVQAMDVGCTWDSGCRAN